MFGGRLLTNHIQSLNQKNCLLAVFSNQLYFFDLNQTQIFKKISLSDHLIKTWIYLDNQSKFIALDENGSLIELQFLNKNNKNHIWHDNLTLSTKKIAKGKISDAKIVIKPSLQPSYKIYFAHENDLFEYEDGLKNIIIKNIQSILFASENHLICSASAQNNSIKILNLKTKTQQAINYLHGSPITACTVYGQSLIIGDQKGKIYQLRNYLSSEKVHQQIATKYQWHVHKVHALFLDQEYLYSCGQQGTVVMWHLRQNKKDFLPRIGTEIDNVFVLQGIVYCFLKDNSIAAVDLSNDKLLKYYKTMISPFGFQTKEIKQKSIKGKNICFVSSQLNSRNLLIVSGLPGSLQIINLNDGSNNQIFVLPRNMISRIDDYYPEPHDIFDLNFNKDWTLMCCSTLGINHNFLHFYKNEGYNLQFQLISKVQNPHKGPIKIISYNNNFITYSQNQQTIRFWSKVRKAKKSIIQKEEQFFMCSGQINYRKKLIKSCDLLLNEHLLLVNFGDEIILIDLKRRSIQMAFKGPANIRKAFLVKRLKSPIQLVLITSSKISKYDLDISSKSLSNHQTIYIFQNCSVTKTQFCLSSNASLAFMINYHSHQFIFEFDLGKNSIINSFLNQETQIVSVLQICYLNGKLIAFSSDSALTNLTSSEQIVKLNPNKGVSITSIETEDDTVSNLQYETLQNIHRNYISKQSVRKRGEISECLQKIELQMYPSLGFSFSALSQKMLI